MTPKPLTRDGQIQGLATAIKVLVDELTKLVLARNQDEAERAATQTRPTR